MVNRGAVHFKKNSCAAPNWRIFLFTKNGATANIEASFTFPFTHSTERQKDGFEQMRAADNSSLPVQSYYFSIL